MRAANVLLILVLLTACAKDVGSDKPETVTPDGSSVGGQFTVADVVGTYYGRHALSYSASNPYNSSSSYSVDTLYVVVRPDTIEPISPNWVYIGSDPFILREDGTLDCNWSYGGQSYCYGAFTIVNDTIRVECERINQMDFSYSRSAFTGTKH